MIPGELIAHYKIGEKQLVEIEENHEQKKAEPAEDHERNEDELKAMPKENDQ